MDLLLNRGALGNTSFQRDTTELGRLYMAEVGQPDLPNPSSNLLRKLVSGKDEIALQKILSDHFEEIARQDFEWLHELKDMGYTSKEIAALLLSDQNDSPWIYLISSDLEERKLSVDFHQPGCVHSGGLLRKVPMTHPTTLGADIVVRDGVSESSSEVDIERTINEFCGLGGVLPVSREIREWNGHVTFDGSENTTALISYRMQPVEEASARLDLLNRLSKIMRGACSAIGELQEKGFCCDRITILRLDNELNSFVELTCINVDNIIKLRRSLKIGLTEALKLGRFSEVGVTGALNSAVSASIEILEAVCGYTGFDDLSSYSTPTDYALHCYSLAVQVLCVAISSYHHAHIGEVRPYFLTTPLREIHLCGYQELHASGKHIVVSLRRLTCMHQMVQNEVLVFETCTSSDSPRGSDIDLDLLALAEDIVDTWGAARFVVDPQDPSGQRLYAIEVRGGTIRPIERDDNLFHWTRGIGQYSGLSKAFDAKSKILIGATTPNPVCPLDEQSCWEASGDYLSPLRTDSEHWEFSELQAGIQGGQYAILQFNSTYVKQPGMTLKQSHLSSPPNEFFIPFLQSKCGLKISFCTGVAQRVPLCEVLADVMVAFVEARSPMPRDWDLLKNKHDIVNGFRSRDLKAWLMSLPFNLQILTAQIVRYVLSWLQDTGINRTGEELIIAWAKPEDPFQCFKVRCERENLWARILADSEHCATFAYITMECLETDERRCGHVRQLPWHHAAASLDTFVCRHFNTREAMMPSFAPWDLQPQCAYWIGKPGSHLIAKLDVTRTAHEPHLIVKHSRIPEGVRMRLERLERIKERQTTVGTAKPVVIIAKP